MREEEGLLKFMKKETKKEVRLFVSFGEKHDKVAAFKNLQSYGVMVIGDNLLPLALGHELKQKIVKDLENRKINFHRIILII